MQGTLTFDDIEDLPEEEATEIPAAAQPAVAVNMLSLNSHSESIPLTRNKTIVGRAPGTSFYLLHNFGQAYFLDPCRFDLQQKFIYSFIATLIEKSTNGAVLVHPRVSGTHCEISSRSMTDADAAIWIKDTSTNGVWVNEKRIPKNETVKIADKDIVSFAAGPVDGKCTYSRCTISLRE